MTKVAWTSVLSGFKPIGAHVDGADVSSAVALTPPAGARKLLIQTTTQNIRYTLDGTTPTTALGFVMVANDPPLIIVLEDGVTVTLIEEAATADVQYQWGA